MKKCLYSLIAVLLLFSQSVFSQVGEYLQVVGDMTINIKVTGSPDFPDLEYSFDKVNWTPITGATSFNKSRGLNSNPVPVCYFRGNNPDGFNKSATDYVSITITGGNPSLAGNVMSLLSKDDFIDLTAIPCDYCFYGLFCPNPPATFTTSYSFASTGSSTSLYHAKDLVLPATELKAYCYAYMFALNSGLIDAPELPATVMKPWCYAHMFDYCINSFCGKNSGVSIPYLPAQELAEGCYAYMFSRCGSLYNDNENYYILPAEELAPKCYMGMFSLYGGISGGTSLKYVEIMATSLKDRCGEDITNCCAYMFNNAIWAGTTNGRQNMTLRMYWTDWGNSTTSPNNADATSGAPTYGWFYGYVRYGNTFLYQNGLTPTTKNTKYGTTYLNHTFPQNGTITANNFTYLTFDCKTNGGTWEESCTYNADLRRVVRTDYTAKTVPAAPVKAAATFKGWFTAPSGGEQVDETTILSQTTAQTYYAQFEDIDLSNITMTTGTLDFPTYYNTFAIEGESELVKVRLYFNANLTTTKTNYLTSFDPSNSYIQPIGGAARTIASASVANVTYLGDAYRAAHIVATVTDTEGRNYNIDIFTNEELNYATYEDVIGTNYNSIVETSWRTCNPFHIYGTENNEMDRLIYRNVNGRHILYTYHMDGGVNVYYEVLHVQLELFPDPTKPGNIPTGIYPINATQAIGTAFIGKCPSDILIYEQNSRQPYCGSFVQYELQATENDYYPNRDVWTLRDGYVEVVNVDEKYWVHVHAYADAHRTTGEDCAVIDYTACLDGDVTYSPVAVTLSSQTENGATLTGAATLRLNDATTMTSAFAEGEHTFFIGSTLNLNADKSGYEFSHWLINGTRVNGNDIAYTLAGQTTDIVAVFTGEGSGEGGNEGGGEGGESGNTDPVSADAAVSVYQNVSKTTTKILYNLDPKTGKDGLTYGLVDMGYGIAWADRNVGATAVGMTGGYFNWGDVVAEPTAGVVYEIGSMAVGALLPAEDDAATANISSDFHIPSDAEWTALINNSTYSGGRFINSDDNSQYMIMPASGYYEYYNYYGYYQGPYLTSTSAAFAWTSQVHSREYGDSDFMSNAGIVTDNGGSAVDIYDGYIYLAAPVRAVYTPPFTTYTLTINVGSYQYRYVCEKGQNITVTAVPTETGYIFDKWTEDGNTSATRTFTMTGDMTYTATFKQDVTYHTVTILAQPEGYGTVTQTSITDIPHGSSLTVSENTITINGTTVTATPAADDAQYTYTFSGWLNAQPSVMGDVTIIALFNRTAQTYTITFQNEDGTQLQSSPFEYGAIPVYNGTKPVKSEDEAYIYTFSGWSPTPSAVTGAATYTAVFASTARQYTITFASMTGGTISVTAGGTAINSGDKVDYGTALIVTAVPDEGYQFAAWMNGTAASLTITGDITLGAIFREEDNPDEPTPTIDLYDNANPKVNGVETTNAALLSSYAGKSVNVILHHSFTANQWNTLCLPFHLDTEDTDLDGIAYELSNCTTDPANGITISFDPVSYNSAIQAEMEAGKPYLVLTETTVSELRFNDVTLVTFTPGKTVARSGDVEFRSVIETTYIQNKTSIYIGTNNRLYYANASANSGKGSRLRGYRGYFEIINTNGMEYAQPRVRLMVGNVEVACSDEDEMNDTSMVRKYVKDGILYIERDGILYDAQGKRLDR